jgi:hypothetical protein
MLRWLLLSRDRKGVTMGLRPTLEKQKHRSLTLAARKESVTEPDRKGVGAVYRLQVMKTPGSARTLACRVHTRVNARKLLKRIVFTLV